MLLHPLSRRLLKPKSKKIIITYAGEPVKKLANNDYIQRKVYSDIGFVDDSGQTWCTSKTGISMN